MSPFWAGLFEDLKGRGRNASLFIFVLHTLVLLAVFAGRIRQETYRDYILPAVPVVALIAVMWLAKIIQNARARRRGRLNLSSLSRDELNRARAKLVKSRGQGTI